MNFMKRNFCVFYSVGTERWTSEKWTREWIILIWKCFLTIVESLGVVGQIELTENGENYSIRNDWEYCEFSLNFD